MATMEQRKAQQKRQADRNKEANDAQKKQIDNAKISRNDNRGYQKPSNNPKNKSVQERNLEEVQSQDPSGFSPSEQEAKQQSNVTNVHAGGAPKRYTVTLN